MTKSLMVPCVHYFDDYPHIEGEGTARSGRRAMEEVLERLGWRVKGGAKDSDCAKEFTTLGAVTSL